RRVFLLARGALHVGPLLKRGRQFTQGDRNRGGGETSSALQTLERRRHAPRLSVGSGSDGAGVRVRALCPLCSPSFTPPGGALRGQCRYLDGPMSETRATSSEISLRQAARFRGYVRSMHAPGWLSSSSPR